MKIFGLAISAKHKQSGSIIIGAAVVQCESKMAAIGFGITQAKELWSQQEYIEHQCSTIEVPKNWYTNDN